MAVAYNVLLKRSAERELRAIPQPDLVQIADRIQALALSPRLPGSEKLSSHDQYRVRQGDYRIVYAVNDKDRIVHVVKIGHRREVYR
ncbi:MAG: type II toxin-antitoxin system RelE/ParE family toxin [Nitrospira defluvii]|nr:type II toxin-antitoxin system RelE/ParE family toxin [Nitrospira defluvii]